MVPLITVTIVVELKFSVSVGEIELEVDSKSGAEVEEMGVKLEKVEVVEVVGMGDGEDDLNVGNVGVVLVGVNGRIDDNIDSADDDIILIFCD